MTIIFDRRRLLLAATGATMTAGTPAWARRAGDPIPAILAETGMPALIGAVVTAEGIKSLGFGGVRRLGAPDKVTANDLWHLGSNTKAMTAALYGRLVETGRAKWGATIPELFPDLALDPAWSKTTVEQLLGHRAGVEERALMMSGWLLTAHADTRPIREQRMDVAKTILGKPPGGMPGAFAYANLNYVLVGAAMERILEASWEDAITAELFKPLGIATAGFGAPQGAQPWGHRMTAPPQPGTPAQLTPVDPAGRADNPPALGPAGRAHMSIQDYAKFVRMFLTKGGGVLKPETIERLTAPVPGGEGRPYALGWGVVPGAPWASGGPVLAHDGSNTMWHASAQVAPARGLAFIAIGNAPPPVGAVAKLLKSLRDGTAVV